ncbi:MAG: hypothetical protein JWM86_404 [Thermoleophilia bacterium]|nr:hypothetical protein [Thermoleophilia bacterium]
MSDVATVNQAPSSTSGFGRGMLLLAIANALYVVTAYVVTTATARMLEPIEFGVFGVVMAWITVLTALLVKGVSTVTAREMAAGDVDAATAWRAGRTLGLQLAVLLTIVGAALSPLVAELLGVPGRSSQIAVGALGALTFGINAVLLAWPTGMRSYGRQALTQVAYALARLVFVVGGAALLGLDGAVIGYVVAPLVAALPLVTRHPVAQADAAAIRSRMRRAVIPISLVSIAVTSYFVVDVFALSAVVGERAHEVGIYVAYGTVAHVPFFLLQAASVAIVPALAATRSVAERGAAIRHAMTDSIVLLAGPTLLLAAGGDAAARVVFGADYESSALVTLPLALATGAVTLLANLVAIEVAIGRLRESIAISVAGAAALAVACVLAARGDVDGAAGRVAWAALAVSAATCLILAALVRVRHGALLEPSRAVRGLALALLVTVPVLLVDHDLAATVVAAACGLVWLFAVIRSGLVDVRRAAPAAPVLDADVP